MIELVYFSDCPIAEVARQRLKSAGIIFVERAQDHLPNGHFLRKFTSPTVLKDGQLVIGSYATGGGCTMCFPAIGELRNLLKGNAE